MALEELLHRCHNPAIKIWNIAFLGNTQVLMTMIANLRWKFSIDLWFDLKLLKDSSEEKEEFSFRQGLPKALSLS